MSRIKLPKLLLEMISIVFAVLLALTLDTWQQDRKEQHKIDKALEDIVLEIRTFSSMETVKRFNEKYLNKIDSFLPALESGEIEFIGTGFGRPEIRSLAWQISKENGVAAGFEREIFLNISEIYVEFDKLLKILDYHDEFELKSDPNMPYLTKVKHTRRHLSKTLSRINDLERKASEFLEKYKDTNFVNP